MINVCNLIQTFLNTYEYMTLLSHIIKYKNKNKCFLGSSRNFILHQSILTEVSTSTTRN